MKLLSLLLLTAVVVLIGTGCVFMNDEDRDFYGKGWVKPTDLDAPMPHHVVADPSHPEQAEQPAAAQRTASADPDTQWLVPESAQH